MSDQERSARAYCHSISANPDEIVWGGGRIQNRTYKPRWQWYVGAKIQHSHAAE
jgi:hypothetical protein